MPIFSFILQVWPRFFNRYFGIDTWRHLMFADYVRKHKKLPKQITDRYLVTGPFNYPPGIILFLSLFPKKFTDDYQFIFSPFFDFVNNYIVFIASLYLTQDITAAIFAQIIAALVPIIVIEASNLSTRIFSNVLYIFSFFPLLLYTYTNSILYLFIAGILLYALFLSHKLAIQSYLFTAIGFTIFEKNPFYILFFLTIFAFTYIFGGRIYRIVLRDHLLILDYWRRNIDLRFAHQFRGIPKKKQTMDFVQRMYMLSLKNPYVYIFGNNPWLAVFLGILLYDMFLGLPISSTINPVMLNKLIIWILIGLISSLVILALKPLRFLGEGQRYIEYCVFPLAIVLGSYASSALIVYGVTFLLIFFIGVLIVITTIIFIQKKTILQDTSRTITKGLWGIISYLNETDRKNVRIAVFPFQMGDAMMYFLRGKVLTSDSVVGLIKFKDIFPIIKKPLIEIIKRYRLNYILFQKDYVTLKELRLKNYVIVKDAGGFILLRVNV